MLGGKDPPFEPEVTVSLFSLSISLKAGHLCRAGKRKRKGKRMDLRVNRCSSGELGAWGTKTAETRGVFSRVPFLHAGRPRPRGPFLCTECGEATEWPSHLSCPARAGEGPGALPGAQACLWQGLFQPGPGVPSPEGPSSRPHS